MGIGIADSTRKDSGGLGEVTVVEIPRDKFVRSRYGPANEIDKDEGNSPRYFGEILEKTIYSEESDPELGYKEVVSTPNWPKIGVNEPRKHGIIGCKINIYG